MRRIACLLLLASVAALSLFGASAEAAKGPIVTQVYLAYQSNGKVPPCKFTAAQLKDALKNVTPDIKQYAPDFEDAIKVALEARATGVCDRKRSSSGSSASSGAAAAPTATSGGTSGGATAAAPAATTSTPAATTATPAATTAATTTTPQPTPASDPAPAVADDAIPAAAAAPAADGADDTPAPLLVLALMLGLLLVLAALWSAVRWMGFDPPWLRRWRHASQEAGWRVSSAWSEFTDWVRLGR